MSEHAASSAASAVVDPDWKAAYHDMRKVADNYAEQVKYLTNQLTFMQHAFLEKTHENGKSSTFAVAARPTLKETQKVVPSPRNGLLVKPKANDPFATQKSLHPVDENVVNESASDEVLPLNGEAPTEPDGAAADVHGTMRM